jgi:preprotein translocase subunit SecG
VSAEQRLGRPLEPNLLKEYFVNTFLLVVSLIVWAISSIGLIIFVLLHSGKGSGLSDMLSGSISPTSAGSGVIEKNLDRITVVFAAAFMVSLLILMVVYPK